MSGLRCVKGMHDILPKDMPRWHFLEDKYRDLVECYGYSEIRTPILEPLELFVRGIGQETDIVEKEMYAFEDKGGARLALRPEGTASVIRSYVQHSIAAKEPISKFYYLGPMFRRERPAKGRYRQFYQAGAELVGAAEPGADAEIIEMAVRFLESIGISKVNVQINSLGDSKTRPVYRKALVEAFKKQEDGLCADCRRRLERNPLRVLDCKNEGCKEIAATAPSVLDYLGDDAKAHFEELKRLLERDQTPFTVVPSMVRGLDYYTRTIFEVQGEHGDLGAQSTIVGGGRYDNLVKEFGGRETPTIGFAFGIERLLLLLGEDAGIASRPLIFVAGIGDGGGDRAAAVAGVLRKKGVKVELSYREGSLRSQLKRADKLGAKKAFLCGEDEASREAVTMRDMKDGSQSEILLRDLENAAEELK